MTHIQTILKQFDEMFLKHIYSVYSGTYQEINDEIKSFLLTSHLTYLQAQKKRLEGTLKDPKDELKGAKSIYELERDSFNSAITAELLLIDEEIKETEKLCLQ
jgi:hypothetical protein